MVRLRLNSYFCFVEIWKSFNWTKKHREIYKKKAACGNCCIFCKKKKTNTFCLDFELNRGGGKIWHSRNVSAPLEARRDFKPDFVLDAEMLRWTPRWVGLCTDEPPPSFPVAASLPAIFRSDNDEPDREPSDSG